MKDNVRELCEGRGKQELTCDAFNSNLRTTFTATLSPVVKFIAL